MGWRRLATFPDRPIPAGITSSWRASLRLPDTAQTDSVSRSSMRSAANPTSRLISGGTRVAAWRRAADRSRRAMTAAYSRSICSSSTTESTVRINPRSHGDLQVSTSTWRVLSGWGRWAPAGRTDNRYPPTRTQGDATVQGTMQTTPLTTTLLMRHGLAVHGDSRVVTDDGTGAREATFADVAGRAERLAAALTRLGVKPGDRVATLAWNHQSHFEAYLAVPGMGAVLHTLNLRLFPEQLAWIINHAEDKVLLVDDSLTPLLAKLAGALPTLAHIIVIAGHG